MKLRYIKEILMLGCIGIFPVSLLAQQSITLKTCREKALAHSQKVKSSKADQDATLAQFKLSKRAMLPSIDFSSSYTYLRDPNQMVVPGYELPSLDGTPSGVFSPGNVTNLAYEHSYNAALEFSLPIYLGGKLQSLQKLSSYASKIAEHATNLSKSDVILDVESSYWGLVSLHETQAELEKTIEFLTDVVKDVTNWFNTGIVTKNEVLKAQVELNNAKLALIEIKNNTTLAKMSLNQKIGNSILDPLEVQDSIIIVRDKANIQFEEELVYNRSEIKILEKQVELRKEQRKIVNADYLPQLVSFANYVTHNPNHFAEQENEFTWNAGLALSIPVFHWGEKRLKTVTQKRAIEKSEYALDEAKEGLTLEIQQAIFRLKESMIKLNFTIVSMEQADENLKLETNRLKEGVTTTRELLNAQMQWLKSNNDYISAKVNVKICEAVFKKSIGRLLR